jgi:hypothetical protein
MVEKVDGRFSVKISNCNNYFNFCEHIFFGLLISKVEELGFVSFSVPNWRLLNGLGYGRFSSVFSCFSEGSDEKYSENFVMKVFTGEAIEMANFEMKVLNDLNSVESTVDRNVPCCRD